VFLRDGLLLLDLVFDNEHGILYLDRDVKDQTMFSLNTKFSGAVIDPEFDG
jgi:hypothetical protein